MSFCGTGRGKEHSNTIHAAFHYIGKTSGRTWSPKQRVGCAKGYYRDGSYWAETETPEVHQEFLSKSHTEPLQP